MRSRFSFWLDINKRDEHNLIGIINELKAARRFSRAIRDGIRLVYDLSSGRTDVLIELFPWVLERHSFPAQPLISDALVERVNRVEKLLLERNPSPVKANPSDLDDISSGIELKRAITDENPGYNIILSGVSMGIAKVEDLTPEIIEYGIRKGRLPESAMHHLPSRPKALKVSLLDAPQFDDNDLAALI